MLDVVPVTQPTRAFGISRHLTNKLNRNKALLQLSYDYTCPLTTVPLAPQSDLTIKQLQSNETAVNTTIFALRKERRLATAGYL